MALNGRWKKVDTINLDALLKQMGILNFDVITVGYYFTILLHVYCYPHITRNLMLLYNVHVHVYIIQYIIIHKYINITQIFC